MNEWVEFFLSPGTSRWTRRYVNGSLVSEIGSLRRVTHYVQLSTGQEHVHDTCTVPFKNCPGCINEGVHNRFLLTA